MHPPAQTEAESSRQWPGWLPLAAFPTLTLVLGRQLPDWAYMWALAVAIFAGVRGRCFVVGHVLLTSLFAFLASVNWALVWWHCR